MHGLGKGELDPGLEADNEDLRRFTMLVKKRLNGIQGDIRGFIEGESVGTTADGREGD